MLLAALFVRKLGTPLRHDRLKLDPPSRPWTRGERNHAHPDQLLRALTVPCLSPCTGSLFFIPLIDLFPTEGCLLLDF